MSRRPSRVKYSWLLIDARPAGLAFLAVEEDEVDVRGDVELPAAELAHGDHEQALGLARQGAQRPAVRAPQPVIQSAQGVAHALLGQRRHRVHHFGEVRCAPQVAGDHVHHHRLAHLPQPACQRRLILRGACVEECTNFRRRQGRGEARRVEAWRRMSQCALQVAAGGQRFGEQTRAEVGSWHA